MLRSFRRLPPSLLSGGCDLCSRVRLLSLVAARLGDSAADMLIALCCTLLDGLFFKAGAIYAHRSSSSERGLSDRVTRPLIR